jgi:chromosomal replication initiation ATPase DnaA
LKKQTSASNGEIGQRLGGLSYSAVAKAFQRFGRKLATDRELSGEIAALGDKVSRVKGCPCSGPKTGV